MAPEYEGVELSVGGATVSAALCEVRGGRAVMFYKACVLALPLPSRAAACVQARVHLQVQVGEQRHDAA